MAVPGVAHFLWICQTYEPDESLSTLEKVTVYSGHATMVAGGFVTGHTEVAQEAFYLHIDGPDKRQWYSDFPARSPKVRAAMKRMNEKLRDDAPHTRSTVTWTHYTYENQKYGLALNSFDIAATVTDEGDVIYRGEVECSYPEDAPVTLDAGPFEVTLNEGVYHALEDAGWLHPYRAVWWWKGPLEIDVDGSPTVSW